MSSTKPEYLNLALHNAIEGFTSIVDQPTDTDIINICQLILPVLMQTKYDELTLTHNLSGFIIPTDRYKHIYWKGLYEILHVVSLYGDSIEKHTTRTEVHQGEVKDKAKRKFETWPGLMQTK